MSTFPAACTDCNICRPPKFSCGGDCCVRGEICTLNDICAPKITTTSPKLWIRDFQPTPEISPCWTDPDTGERTCSTINDTPTPRFSVGGDGFSYGQVRVGIFKAANDRALWTTVVQADWAGGAPGGSFEARSTVLDCRSSVGTQAYARALDITTGKWSGKVPLLAGTCANL